LIAGNSSIGVIIYEFLPGAPPSGNLVQGNIIGGYSSGGASLGNLSAGVSLGGKSNTIGGTAAGAGNLISGNRTGIVVFGSDNTIQGNTIGTDVTGAAALGNSEEGVAISAPASNTRLGGTASGAGNVIAFNGQGFSVPWRGVFVGSGTGHSIRGNSIHSNNGLGIDLAPAGVTLNDPQDPDAGANQLQNFPVIASATAAAGTIVIQGSLNSTPNTPGFAIEFFDNSACDASGYGEGETLIGSATVSTNAQGDATFMAAFSVAVPLGHSITATATDPSLPSGNTSEFSACASVASSFAPVFPILRGLNRGLQSGLSSKLNAALDSSGKGDAKAACRQLSAFRNEVNALLRSRRLGESAAAALIGVAKAIEPGACPAARAAFKE
jgi:hypothetical protein